MVTATKPKRSPRSRRPSEIVGRVRPLVDELAAELELTVWQVGFVREAGRDVLRVAVDRQGGVTADELATFSETLSHRIDRADVVPGEARYVLEVTSPGAERKLEGAEQFRVCLGRVAKITLCDGRSVEGVLRGVSQTSVEIDVGGDLVRALHGDIARARLVVKL
jgi:ribosome maturation factor RimP